MFSAAGSGSARSAATSGVDGRTVLLNGHGYRVVGETARGFHRAELHLRLDIGGAGDANPGQGRSKASTCP